MGQIAVSIAGRTYRMACDDGQEDHLHALAARLDLKIAEMRVQFGEIGDQRITVMAALTLADEAAEAEKRAAALAAEVETLRGSDTAAETRINDFSESAATALIAVARRVERLSQTLEPGPRPAQPWLE